MGTTGLDQLIPSQNGQFLAYIIYINNNQFKNKVHNIISADGNQFYFIEYIQFSTIKSPLAA